MHDQVRVVYDCNNWTMILKTYSTVPIVQMYTYYRRGTYALFYHYDHFSTCLRGFKFFDGFALCSFLKYINIGRFFAK
jgi:hypothetical protein